MKIRPDIEIFTDPNYCENRNQKSYCEYLTCNTGKTFCAVYKEFLEGTTVIKCDQCKADYLRAKKEEPTDIIIIDGYRFNCMKSHFYVNGSINTVLKCNDQDRKKFSESLCYPEKKYHISTHEGLFNHFGMIKTTGMFKGGGKMLIEISILIVE